MSTNYDVKQMKLSFAYDIPYQFPENTNIIGGEKALLNQRTDLLVKYLNNQCTYKDITDIDEKIKDQRDTNGYHDTPISSLEYEIQQLKTTTNQKFARRLYCGKIWTHNGLCFTKRYYGIDN